VSIFFFDSMAHVNTAAQMATKWDNADTAPAASSGAFGYYGTRPASNGNALAVNFPSVTTLELSAYFIPAMTYGQLIEFWSSDFPSWPTCSIAIYADGHLEFARGSEVRIGGTSLAVSAAAAVAFNTHHHIYVKVVFSQTVGTIDVKIDGASVISASDLDDCYQPTADCTQIRLFGGGSSNVASVIWSHVALANASGDIPGRPRVQAVFPDGAGNYSQWNLQGAATHYGAVGEQFPDDDTSYVYESTVGDRDSWTYSNFLSTTDTVLAVAVVPRARTDDGAARTMKTFVRAGGVDYDHANTESVPGSYAYLQQIYQVNPATGVAWTAAEINAIEAGIKVVS
jgi:hypothetical protein